MALGGFTYMTEERVKLTQAEMLAELSEFKKRRETLATKLHGWGDAFNGAWNAASNLRLPSNFNFELLPERSEVIEAWDEFDHARREIDRLRESFKAMGIEIQ